MSNVTKRILFFHADWCGQCRLVAPGIRAVAGDLLVDVDLSNNTDAATEYGVTALPTVIVEVAGQETCRIVGPKSNSMYRRMLL